MLRSVNAGAATGPVAERPVVERPVVERPVVERPVAGRPVVGRSVVGTVMAVGMGAQIAVLAALWMFARVGIAADAVGALCGLLV